MLKRCLFALFISVHGVCYAQPAKDSPANATSPVAASSVADSANRELHPVFERYEGGSKESEAKLIRSLAA